MFWQIYPVFPRQIDIFGLFEQAEHRGSEFLRISNAAEKFGDDAVGRDQAISVPAPKRQAGRVINARGDVAVS